jgi:hypothetical protein
MSTTSGKENAFVAAELVYVSAPRHAVLAKQFTATAWEAAHEGQALFTMSLHTARPGRPLRSRSDSTCMRQVRRRTGGEHQLLSTEDRQEATMRNTLQYSWNGTAQRCAICDGRFGLVRHYSWRTALCSKKCADRFKARQEGDRRWLRRLHAA